jgi:hypothetical protein
MIARMQRIADEIDSEIILARPDFVNVHGLQGRFLTR